ncbi:hypothetical protein [Flavobacterium sp.]|uniref:hypothetical protein n=1 Tax=Flavobacterium sp. TaxID=239 RepID=UPI003D6AE1D7
MKKTDLLIGTLIGLATTLIGVYAYLTFFVKIDFIEGIKGMKSEGHLGKVITLGAILNIIAFFILLRIDKELMARGVVLATILLTIVTLFV